MPVVEASIVVNAPIDKVFALQDDPWKSSEYVPGVVHVGKVTYTDERLGDSATVVYSVLGLRFASKATVVEWVRNEKMVMKLEGGLEGTLRILFTTFQGATNVSWRISYSMRGGILGKAANALLVQRMNEKNIERSLENIKLICEEV